MARCAASCYDMAMHDGDPLVRIDRIRSFATDVWHDIMESNRRANILIILMVALAWIGLLRVSYLAVHPSYFTTQVAAAGQE
ncbi:MAG: hypothetical protein UY70_C0022G0014 [Candidatus Kaiserbacteria bacterium GW2011_GWB1_52_6]|uniref:Uncharacterized protein n=3 Tax=Candidatus Kaiseribacteriota TaxID=1752734 RepID=A0A0G1XIK6_9BACT|nr:MAG: hypothetical protein UY67_C0002G0028 [Candidatus Kaiserbacteria bacterium GW2011_GWA2_52_12]KKW26535.1 MAG: hypothetical protein UY70_C0022G0014 [Candidatus Kaiserbacteria bacterium GW2011_GWB1_52_6]KKW30740.1 MAG: hypothetical protein UY74_C0033G0014 [Candidatus Kaiserbacteria bacterium GW2011_GWC2_52_8b]